MTNEQRGAMALFKLELRRAIRPVLRGLITPALLVAWGAIGSVPRPDLVIAGLFGALAITATVVGFQVGRDRNDGTLAYFATLPIRGGYLAGIRFATAATLSAAMAALLVVPGHLLFPGTPWGATVWIAAASFALATLTGWILIAPMTELDWAKLFTGLMATALAVGFILDKTGWGAGLASYLGSAVAAGQLGGLAGALAVVIWLGGITAACGAFIFTAWSLQPGGRPTSRALVLLARERH